MRDLRRELFLMGDAEYRKLQIKLIPNISPNKIIGVRMPTLRKFAKELCGTPDGEAFLSCLPHAYFDEDNLHAFLIERVVDFDEAISKTEDFLPYIDNWATCDCFSPKVFAKNKDRLLTYIKRWIKSDKVYTVRYAMGMLLKHYLDDEFSSEYLHLVNEVKSEEYYIKMMQAWYFATAFAKQYEAALPFLIDKKLEKWVHNKTIQKAVESYRISPENKDFLRGLRQK